MGYSTLLAQISVSILPILFGITVHEVAHGWMAKQLGDPTAQRLGRLTLNPIKHIDPLGTVLVPLMLVMVGVRPIGWAKPVPVTWENLRNPKRDMALVAAAGPAANLLMALIWAFAAKVATTLPPEMIWIAKPLYAMGVSGILINAVLMVLNLIPIPPLDGGRVAVGLLPGPLAWQLSRIEPYGMFAVLILFFLGALNVVLLTPALFVGSLVARAVGLDLV